MAIEKVMLIDDDASIRRIGQTCLTKIGKWEVTLAASGYAAFELLDTYKPDVILLDVVMPDLDGITAFPEIHRKTGGITPIIFMTAKVNDGEIERYLELGAAGVISKPFEPMQLAAEVESIVADFQSGIRISCA